MIEQYAHSLASFLQANPSWGSLITFFIAFLESLPVIGTIIPGSVTMTAVGMLIGTTILPFWLTFFWAVLGAFLGDLLGYWVGIHYNERLRRIWPFSKRPQWLEAGESFFHRHGGKSILIGRFIGPLRSIIPLIAGLLHMPFKRFLVAAIPSAALWALVYILPGILIGALSMQLPREVATKFMLILLLIIVVISLFAWLINISYNKLKMLSRHFSQKIWRNLLCHRKYDWFTNLIANKRQPEDFQQFTLFCTAILSCILFIFVMICAFGHCYLISFNRPVFEFLRSIRSPMMDKVMIGITMFGAGHVLVISGALILAWFWFHKNKREAWHFLVAIVIGVTLPNLLKFLLYFPRPTSLLKIIPTSSFPSGHTFLSLMFYGTLTDIIATHIRLKYRRYLYYLLGILILLIAFSRLYLGAHWVTDILASFTLGYTFIALIIVSYRKDVLPIKVRNVSIFAIATTVILWGIYFTSQMPKNLLMYSLHWPSQVIDIQSWWGSSNAALPIYRQNRIGEPAEPMNINFSGDINQLKTKLLSRGWIANPDMTLLNNTIKKLSQGETFTPILPSLYLNRPPLLFMTKENGHEKLVLKLWRSNIYLADTWNVLYVGNVVEYKIDDAHHKIIYSYNVLDKLIPYLDISQWRLNSLSRHQIHQKLLQQNWQGEVLQISAPALY